MIIITLMINTPHLGVIFFFPFLLSGVSSIDNASWNIEELSMAKRLFFGLRIKLVLLVEGYYYRPLVVWCVIKCQKNRFQNLQERKISY